MCTIQYFINIYEVVLASFRAQYNISSLISSTVTVRLFWQPKSSIQYFIKLFEVVLTSWAQNNTSSTCMKLFWQHGLNTIFHQHVWSCFDEHIQYLINMYENAFHIMTSMHYSVNNYEFDLTSWAQYNILCNVYECCFDIMSSQFH